MVPHCFDVLSLLIDDVKQFFTFILSLLLLSLYISCSQPLCFFSIRVFDFFLLIFKSLMNIKVNNSCP